MIVMFTAVLFAGCMMEKPTAKNYRKVMQMEELTPITVAQLKQIIAADTTHYKVVVLTSSCCGPCHISMRDVYPRKMAECDSNRVRWYFIEGRIARRSIWTRCSGITTLTRLVIGSTTPCRSIGP